MFLENQGFDMTSETEQVVKALADTAQYGLMTASDAMLPGGNRLSVFLQAYAPEQILNWFEGRRLRIRQIKAQEDIFENICAGIVSEYRNRAKEFMGSNSKLKDPMIRNAFAEMEGDLRILNTLRLALSHCKPQIDNAVPELESNNRQERIEHQVDSSWFDTFEMFARRRNESWRTNMFARALVEDDGEPGCISLKSLWELGMMSADDFGSLAVFCDSALYIDDAPMIFLEPEAQARYEFDTDDGLRVVNLAYAIAGLIEAGLVHKSTVQFETTETVRLDHLTGPSFLSHTLPEHFAVKRSALQLDGFGVSNSALDLCRLYQSRRNEASDANMKLFQSLLSEQAKEDPDDIGEILFFK